MVVAGQGETQVSDLQYRTQQPPQIWHNNPVLVQLLGLSPLMAVSTVLVNGLALGLTTVFVLLLASITISLCRQLLSRSWRFVIFMFVLALYTTLFDIILQRYYFALSRDLGVYVPLICCNMALVLHLETQASQQNLPQTLRSTGIVCLGYLLALAGFAALREGIISGRIGLDWRLLIPDLNLQGGTTPPAKPTDLFRFARFTPAALILLGLILALRNLLTGQSEEYRSKATVTPVKRARVTGKIQAS